MSKLTKLVLAALLAAPLVIKYMRKRRLHAYVNMNSEKPAEDENEDEVFSEGPEDYYIRIPAFAVAAVIGKRGNMLRKIMFDTQTDCVIRTFTPKELDVDGHSKGSSTDDWVQKLKANDWLSDEESECFSHRNITYLIVKTDDEVKLRMVRLQILEICKKASIPFKTSKFLVDSDKVGCLVGRGGRNIRNLRDMYNVQIYISDPNPDDPRKSTVTVQGRDLQTIRDVEIVMKETTFPMLSEKVPKYDDDVLVSNGVYDDVEQELEDLRKTVEALAQ